MTDDETLMGVRVPDELKQLVDADQRDNKEVVIAALWNEFGGKRKPVMQSQIDSKREQLNALTQEKQEIKEEEDRVRKKINALESKLDKMQGGEEAYINALDGLLDRLESRDIEHIYPESPEFDEIVNTRPESKQDAFADLKERAKEQEREITNYQFMKAVQARQSMQAEEYIYEVDNE